MAQPDSQPTLRDALNGSLVYLFSEARFSLVDLRESAASDSASLARPQCVLTLLTRNGEWWMKIGPNVNELYDIDDVYRLVVQSPEDAPLSPGYGQLRGLDEFARTLQPHIVKIVDLVQSESWSANRERLIKAIDARRTRAMQAFAKSANKNA